MLVDECGQELFDGLQSSFFKKGKEFVRWTNIVNEFGKEHVSSLRIYFVNEGGHEFAYWKWLMSAVKDSFLSSNPKTNFKLGR